MTNEHSHTPALLILGCGYLGREVVHLALKAGFAVDTLTRNTQTAADLKQAGVRHSLQAELHDSSWHSAIDPATYQAIYITVGSSESTPEGYRKSYLDGLQSVITWAQDCSTHLIYTSSISVYGSSQGQWIDESTLTNPRDWRGHTLLESEQLLLNSHAQHSTILRLGGIYGPGRDRFLRSGKASSSPAYYLNLIHVSDAANALLRVPQFSTQAKGIYNLTDNHPFFRQDLDAFVLEHGLVTTEQSPQSVGHRRKSPANRRIRSTQIQELLSWQPQYRSVFAFLRPDVSDA